MVKLRYPKPKDAKKFYKILNNMNSTYYYATIPDSIEMEKEWIKRREYKRQNNLEYNYAIILNNEIVGGCAITIYQEYNHIGEIGYFVDENYSGHGIATQTVWELEKIAFNQLNLVRLEIRIDPNNKTSEKVAIKNNYIKEGLIHKAIEFEGNYFRKVY
ncbi:GNAT family N-acetyltransferase [Clostridium sp. D2Q-14]|uniref:GNAT family N-acetyltransferase n=1 Tax=Anaeromonas gelatinilytica TaxID=2683194 RepID=UPI00193B4A08|nr:GNAT family N-acetyltransferase [Anaeromonas gelatinilytica]MBS4535738.1 GNAT family N-acetyltransferase [Anaeromonas gelatinilytica]